MTTKELLKKAADIIGKRMEIRSVLFSTELDIENNFNRFSIIYFYKIKGKKENSFVTLNSKYDIISAENLILKLQNDVRKIYLKHFPGSETKITDFEIT